ncbi:Tetratricopeptide repeat-containing protein [Chryseobacterium rhizoplanae]|uniref:Tetratricopeptide repeat-containing protein n=1 Tax=Chryseobacterium rhizoplanae TaxID=1609531 RepID=A0A521AIL8_9FLAO|nr:tetratricopeptide repeat protein [Chryseobacterium rhizoplanae]SMO34684.1 Tetratricopeptide repeat-containing protein [Chryseobacterium rhizoplanae]
MKKTLLLSFSLLAFHIVLGQSSYNQAHKEYDSQNFKKAIFYFDKAISAKENILDSYLYRGMSYLYLYDAEKCRTDFDKVLELDPKNKMVYTFYGKYYALTNQFAKAVESYTIALERMPDDYRLYGERGAAKAELGMYSEALADADISVQKQPNNYRGYLNRGYVKMRMDKYVEAVEDFNVSLSIQKSEKGYEHRGTAYALLRKNDAALQDFEKALEYNPNNPLVLYYQGEVLLSAGQQEKACKSFLKSKQLGNNGIDDVISKAKCSETKN